MSRRAWIGIGVAAAVLLAAAVGFLVWLRLGGEGAIPLLEQIPGLGQLPGAQEREQQRTAEKQSGVLPEPTPAGEQASLPEATTSLAVKLTYQTRPSFQLSVTRVARTFEVPTIERHQPRAGEPFSRLKIWGVSGQLLSEHTFTVPSEIHIDTFDQGIQKEDASVGRSELDIVVPLTGVPGRVQVISAKGDVMSEQGFVYDELPTDQSQQREPITLIPRAWAQETAGGSPFVIAVTDHEAPGVRALALAATHGMVTEIEPWRTYNAQGLVRVVEIPGGDLGCGTLAVEGGDRVLPGCANSGKVYRHIHEAGVEAHAIVVAVNASCAVCGASVLGSGIAGVGTRPTPRLAAHELGHAIRYGRLSDEYLYQFQVEGPPQGPNCFPETPACEAAIAGFDGASCHAGCDSITTVRPSENALMHSLDLGTYGPLQTCLMSRGIAQDITVAEAGLCQQQGAKIEDIFWGWFRGG